MSTHADHDRYATETDATPPGTVQGRPLIALAHRIEHEERLDGAVTALRPVANALAGSAARSLLLGRQLGHAVHPMLTDVPIGAWVSALVLDLVGGEESRPAARRLVGVGILAAVPTAVTGLAEWSHTEERDSRVGVVHASANGVGLAMFTASYCARRAGHQRAGVALGLLGGLTVGIGGYLGAHLAIARNVASRDSTFLARPTPPGGPATEGATAPVADD